MLTHKKFFVRQMMGMAIKQIGNIATLQEELVNDGKFAYHTISSNAATTYQPATPCAAL
jgi:hypothetical protein